MGLRQLVRSIRDSIVDRTRQFLLAVLLRVIYFGFITPYALIWRWVLRQGLLRSRGGWVAVSESTDTPELFQKTV